MQRYRVGRLLGRGGAAEVYEATLIGEGGFERKVAIKRLTDAHPDRDAAQAFQDEARLAARLDHPNVLRVFDYGLMDGAPFLVMDHNDGKDLGELFRGSKVMPASAALYLAAEVARGLHHAHRAVDERGKPLSLVHRDVSPDNILIAWTGQVRLADFGIASFVDRDTKTKTGIVRGKRSYIAPERWAGRGFDHRADLFALGCVLYTLLARRPPNDELRARGISEQAWSWIRAQPEDIREILERTLAQSPDQRYADAETLALACERAAFPRADKSPRTDLESWLEQSRVPPAPASAALLEWFELELAEEDSEEDGLPIYRTRVMGPPTVATEPGFESFTASTMSATVPRIEPGPYEAERTLLLRVQTGFGRLPWRVVLTVVAMTSVVTFWLARPAPEPARELPPPPSTSQHPKAIVDNRDAGFAKDAEPEDPDAGLLETASIPDSKARPELRRAAVRSGSKDLERSRKSLRAGLEKSRRRAGLLWSDLDEEGQRDLAALDSADELASARRSADRVQSSIERRRDDPEILLRRLEKIKARIKDPALTLPLDVLGPLEERYLDLRARARSPHPAQANQLVLQIGELEAQLDRLK